LISSFDTYALDLNQTFIFFVVLDS